MVTRIFIEHGMWAGNSAMQAHSHHYTIYENTEIKTATKQIWYRFLNETNSPHGTTVNPKPEDLKLIKDTIDNHVPDINQLVYKGAAEYAPLFYQFNPKIVLVKRDWDQAIKSMVKKANDHRDYQHFKEIYDRRINYMHQVEKEHGAKWIDADQIIQGDYSSVKSAMEYCGIPYNESAVERSINAGIWKTR